ncbi:hypothetical protein SAMN04487885_102138 [Clostridium cadaveris]|uniref:DUF374 domain-containing protein n=1 Tax=Clostridium cadaveris TaxID=1529 RepID=A0A1I2JKE9_9CLOT|nr:hypothetical protein [Clostridium cadaveris]MDM8311014.1 hypothetical protein [Clostridium cadaveris]SFF54719.1 hypothetical protein SAMN04487885_102138 [Clostridium cadaveris]
MWDKALIRFSWIYIELVYRTMKWDFSDEFKLNEVNLKNCILGFWHGQSYAMNFLIKKIYKENYPMTVIVTADKRGDYIEETIGKYGVGALRVPDGAKIKNFLRYIKDESNIDGASMAISLDGPLGPFQEPKKLGPLLSNKSGKKFIGVNLKVSKKISLKNRWDNYIIPLPFSIVKVEAYDFKNVQDEDLKHFIDYKEIIKSKLC